MAIGVSILISRVVQGGMFGISGERMTKRLRARAFETMLRQEIGWFDAKENNVGKLCTQLAVDASAVQGVKPTTNNASFCIQKLVFFIEQ